MLPNCVLAPYTSIRIGGPVTALCQPKTQGDLSKIVDLARILKVPLHILGFGSNLLISSKRLFGIAVCLKQYMRSFSFEGAVVRAEAGASLPKLVFEAAKRNLGGMAFGAGIPGSVGGSLVMNAGTGGNKWIGHFVEYVEVMDRHGKISRFGHDELSFSYRSSALRHSGNIVLGGCLRLRPMQRELAEVKIKAHLARRKATQPLGIPNCGSVFKRPEGDYAGRLIESLGLKGRTRGRSQISTKHANFIINLGEANSEDVGALIDEVRSQVLEKTGILLEPEVEIWSAEQ